MGLQDNPVQFWELFGEQGHPIRTTVSESARPLARLMDLKSERGRRKPRSLSMLQTDGLLLDLDDLQAMLVNCGNRAEETDAHLWEHFQAKRRDDPKRLLV
ncbi:MAG: DUF853 family protein [Sphingomonadales bacterium]|nr:DUF853 family protein [Sphingomonadales bacterium]